MREKLNWLSRRDKLQGCIGSLLVASGVGVGVWGAVSVGNAHITENAYYTSYGCDFNYADQPTSACYDAYPGQSQINDATKLRQNGLDLMGIGGVLIGSVFVSNKKGNRMSPTDIGISPELGIERRIAFEIHHDAAYTNDDAFEREFKRMQTSDFPIAPKEL
jgi:hypothetical protein